MIDAPRLIAAAAACAAWIALVAWTRWRQRAGRDAAISTDAVLVAYASQTGTAAALAQATAAALVTSGRTVALRSLEGLTPAMLAETREALFLVATTGEGDAPDDAARFLQQTAARPLRLPRLRYALLALGDTHYRHFCAFGRALDRMLGEAGATPAADRVEVDQSDTDALRHWQQNLRLFGASAALPDWEAPGYMRWRLSERELFNPGGSAPMFRLRLEPEGALPEWNAGDIAEVYPGPAEEATAPSPPLPHRDYSIATVPGEGAIGLVVRLLRDTEGRSGLGSGWLCERAAMGATIAMRVRANPRFHTPDAAKPLILIGNGTGISALRAHLRARPAGTRNWLIFGERDPVLDRPFDAELRGWASTGHLARLNRIFSRGGGSPGYVQDAIAAEAETLRAWAKDGTAILVCGSIAMGADVDAALRATLGPERLNAMLAEGLYRRDTY